MLPDRINLGQIVGVDDLRPAVTLGRFRRKARQLQPARPNLGDPALRIGKPEHLRMQRHGVAIVLLAALQGRLRNRGAGHVLDDDLDVVAVGLADLREQCRGVVL